MKTIIYKAKNLPLYILTLLATTSIALILISCSSAKENKDRKTNDFTVITYNYQASSVPPQFQRSYTIKVTKHEVSYNVRSYQDTLLMENHPINESQIKKIQSLLSTAKGYGSLTHTSEPGSDYEGLVVINGNTEDIDAYWNSKTPESIRALINEIKRLVRNNAFEVGTADYEKFMLNKKLNNYVLNNGTYTSIKDTARLPAKLVEVLPILKQYLNSEECIFKNEKVNLDDYYSINKNFKVSNDEIQVSLVHKETLLVKANNNETATISTINPSGKDGNFYISLKKKKVTAVNIWE